MGYARLTRLLPLVALAATGCQDSTAPDPPAPPPAHAVFTPAALGLSAAVGETLRFTVDVVGEDDFQTVYMHQGELIGIEPELRFVPLEAGEDSLRATVTFRDEVAQHTWRLQVVEDSPLLPPRPRDLDVTVYDQVYFTWEGAPHHEWPTPLSRYEIRALPREAIDGDNWDDAFPVAEVAYAADRTTYVVVAQVGPPAVPIATPVGFAVRLVDEAGAMSVPASQEVFVPHGVIVEGVVRDLAGEPLPGMEVTWSYYNGRTLTDADGHYRTYLLPLNQAVTLDFSDDGLGVPGTGTWYDVRYVWRAIDGPIRNATLIPVAPLDSDCASVRYQGEFLNFLRDMTATDPAYYPRLDYITARWLELPITVHVADAWNEDETFAYHVLADSALAIWNQRLGQDYFERVAAPDTAELLVFFSNDNLGGNIGATRITDPPQATLNLDIPSRMSIQVRRDLHQPTFAFEILLHELGHALCVGQHSKCAAGTHLMQSNPAGIIAARWPDSPISDDEVRLIHTLYRLSPFEAMDTYRVD